MSNRETSFWAIAGATLAGGLLAYAVYFDYKRRNDAEFRKKLRKEKKRAQNLASSKQEDKSTPSLNVTPAMLRAVLEEIKPEPYPKTPAEREQYFMAEVSAGEQLSLQGPAHYLTAAKHFFKALRVYPSPVELIVIYQKTIPEPVFKIVMDLTNLDVADRVEGYFNHFPPASTNVIIEGRDDPATRNLALTKDVKTGDVIYKEFPIVATLDSDIQAAGTHCTHCFRVLQSEHTLEPEGGNPLPSRYCSAKCQTANQSQSHSLLFTLESPLPPSIRPPDLPDGFTEPRKEAQAKYLAYLKKYKDQNTPLLLARFIARQINIETAKLSQSGQALSGEATTKAGYENGDFTDAVEGSYGLADHLERLMYKQTPPPEGELELVKNLMATALPGLEAFITDERFATMRAQVAYNAFGVCFDSGRDGRPDYSARPEDVEKTRTPHGTSRQIGSAFYTLSSYLKHSCSPTARPVFAEGTTELQIVANRDMKAGEEVTIAWVDVNQLPSEGIAECRRRRRYELVRGWKLACECDRCEEEAKAVEDTKPVLTNAPAASALNGSVEPTTSDVVDSPASETKEPVPQENGQAEHEQKVEEPAAQPLASNPVSVDAVEVTAAEVASEGKSEDIPEKETVASPEDVKTSTETAVVEPQAEAEVIVEVNHSDAEPTPAQQ